MALRVALTHRTKYKYDRPVNMGPHVLRLRPAPHCRTPIHSYSLRVKPEKHFINWQQDPFGNFLARFVFSEPTTEFSFEVDLVAEMTVINPFEFFVEASAAKFPFAYDDQSRRELLPYLEIRESGPALLAWLEKVSREPKVTVDFLVELNQRLQGDIGYLIRMEPGVQTCEQTLTTRSGSCRDSAWLLVQILRHLGFASRFVSGYLVQLAPDEKPLEGPVGPTADFTDLHAWAEAFVPGAGWVGLDPTSGLFAGEGHIPLACTPDPQSAAPVTGAVDKCEVTFEYSNEVTRVHEDPRTTRPYRVEQWEAIDALGAKVDAELRELDVRLTMGGEPTFVAIDNLAAPEWNTAALGPQKRKLADRLLRRLAEKYGTGSALHHGQGKWYPGEELPRWAFAAVWRKDGLPIWHDPDLIAEDGRDYGITAKEAQLFASELAKKLRVNADHVQPAYEDTYYYLWKEQQLPANVDPLKVDLKDGLERKRISRLLEGGLGNVVGYVLPLRWDFGYGREGWQSGAWDFRRGRLYLLPGDSAMGYRLPLDSLQFVEPEKREPFPEACPSDDRETLPDLATLVQKRYSRVVRDVTGREWNGVEGVPGGDVQTLQEQTVDLPAGQVPGVKISAFPGYTEPSDPVVRTALCLEPRQGRLHLFLPPVSHLEQFLDLLHCIEQTASELQIPVVMEGYPAPYDPRIQRVGVTPDPGVIEVNLHPAASWDELVWNTSTLYEEARLCGLTTQKHLLDGRLTGTGGGNHITLGGATVGDSPMLRRPDLLKSLVTYWQHHPSLSYLFAGMFIGPTSQMPRIDEARHESLYELQLAFDHLRRQPTSFPWTIDRMLRHLLVDLTGNTHRAEFCIDKLYSPDSLAGRLGLLEMRGFEMPPHAKMSAVQMLLLRSLIAAFWKAPYDKPLAPLGTELHDRFLLPEFVWADFREVIDELQRRGCPIELDWFRPFFEFRFPIYGSVQVGPLELEVRMALEPWHVLGEEASAGGTSRYVDSSVERVQVKSRGVVDTRHVLLCNGRRVPMRSAGIAAEEVGGVRFRAWQPPSCLHPLIPVHSPLVFDLYDTWSERSLGGCTYHVAHPGGRAFEEPPVNAQAAEARRLARFWPHGHTPGKMPLPPIEINEDYPYTLDLRRVPGA
jgi:uncharacterized protein (DUF2126 family)/transglutaminase-like putative cysteine protease